MNEELHPVLEEIVSKTKKAKLPLQKEQCLEDVREAFARMRTFAGEPEPIYKTDNLTIPSTQPPVPVRLYYPEKRDSLPVLLYFHPGGFVKGDIETHDPICRMLANRCKALVISVGYRLAPEFQFPAPVEDAWAVYDWILQQGKEFGADPKRIAVGGESSGGNLATVLAHLIRQKNVHSPLCQVLIYPMVDFTFSFPSHKKYGKGYLLEEESLHWYRSLYAPSGQDLKHPYLSPLWAKNFKDQPKTLLILAQYDPLRDEGAAYGEKLMQAGVDVEVSLYEGMTHGFFQMPDLLGPAFDAMAQTGHYLMKVFNNG